MNAIPRAEVSVVINVFDEDPAYVLEAVASAEAQTHRPSEIIAVEDGARRDFSAIWNAHPNIRVIRQQNQGLAAARNAGLAEARGAFIVFLDGDDRLLPDAIAANLAVLLERTDAGMAYGGWRFINREGHASRRRAMPPLGPDPYADMLRGNCIGMHATVLYRRAFLERLGGFDVTYRLCEDYELYLRAVRQAPVLATTTVLAEYRQHGDNISKARSRMLDAALRVLAAQDAHLGTRDDWRQARRQGVAAWKEFYAGQFLTNPRRPGAAPLIAALPDWAAMVRRAPMTMMRSTMRRAFSAIKTRLNGGRISFGDLRRTTPISERFGFDRGRPVDRYYIEAFLGAHADDVRGRVLEVGDASYTRQFGGARVTLSEVLHVSDEATGATYCTDLSSGRGIPDDLFDCIILTQTLHLIFDVQAAIRTLHRILKPGGCVLLTVPGVSSIDRGEWHDTWYWSFTPPSLGRSLEAGFARSDTQIGVFGNVLSATAFLHGLADHELTPAELDVVDRHYPVIVTAVARRPVNVGD